MASRPGRACARPPAYAGASGDAVRIVLACSLLLSAVGLLPAIFRASPARAEDGSERRRLPTARVTAVRPEELPDDPSSFATLIEVDEREGEAETVASLLDESVGVQVRSFGGPGQASEISIRGSSGQQVVVMLDGVRLNTAQSGTVDLSTLPLALVDRIEVARGGGSAQEGSGAIGGVVNVVTRRPTGEPETHASLGAGSFGTWQGSLSHADRAGPVDWGATYSGFTSDGDWKFKSVEVRADGETLVPSQKLRRINNDSESHSTLVQAAGDLADGLRLRAWDSFYFTSRGQPGPDDEPLAQDGGQNRHAHERVARNVAAVTVESDGWAMLPDSVGMRSTVSYLFEQTRFRDPQPDVGAPIETRQKNRSAAWKTSGSWQGKALGAEHEARVSLDLRYDSLSAGEAGFHRRYTEGVSVRDEIGLWKRRVQLVPTLRFDHTDDYGSEWIPHLGLIVSPAKWLRFKGNVERSYRAPDFDELFFPDKGFIRGNPDLDPEDAWNYDVGFELGFAQLGFLEDLRLQAAWFYQDIENSIVFQRISPDTVAPTNTNDATVQGFELSGSFGLLDWLELSANWTHQDGELDRARLAEDPGGLFPPIGAFPGTAIPGQADDEYQLRAKLGPQSGLFKIVAVRRYRSKIHLNFSDSSTLSSRTLYDLSAAVDVAQLWHPDSRWWPDELIASVSVVNLTDESVRDSLGFPQPGRFLSFGLEGRW
jgi:outer membrane cobalamin receptor